MKEGWSVVHSVIALVLKMADLKAVLRVASTVVTTVVPRAEWTGMC